MAHYSGECQCAWWTKEQEPCTYKAYFNRAGRPACGYHRSQQFTKLPKNPAKAHNDALAVEAHNLTVQAAMRENDGRKGKLTCTKLKMMQPIPFTTGYQNVLPNRKHTRHTRGIGCSTLSPMNIKPDRIPAGEPLSIENFHQGSKHYAPLTNTEFFEARRRMWADPKPHRHNAAAKGTGHNRNVPMNFVWTRADGTHVRYNYVQSRQFYCTMLARAIVLKEQFLMIKKMLTDGYNICICGYDAYDPVTSDNRHMNIADIIEHAYLDASRPFGHELVIYTLLALEPSAYPWTKYTTEVF